MVLQVSSKEMSFAYSYINELVTLSEHNIPVVELVMNNNVLGMVRQWQRLFYGKRFSQTTLDLSLIHISRSCLK